MNAMTAWMEKHFIPIAAKIGSQKHLVALRDAFIGMLPVTMAGSLATMISAIVTTVPQSMQQMIQGTASDGSWTLANTPVFEQLNGIAGYVNQGTLTVIGLIFAFSWGYQLSRAYKVNELAGGIIGVSTLMAGLPNIMGKATEGLTLDNLASMISSGAAPAGTANLTEDQLSLVQSAISSGVSNQAGQTWMPSFFSAQMNAMAYFTVIIMGAITVIIYAKLMNSDKLSIKMPDSVPPAVGKAFLALLPTIVALSVAGLIYYIVDLIRPGDSVVWLVAHYIAEPFQRLSQGIGAILIVTFFVSLLWFFGIHGPNVLSPALDGIWGPLGLDNIATFGRVGLGGVRDLVAGGYTSPQHANAAGEYITLWVRGSWDAFAWFGGSGGTITLLVAILVFSKRKDYRTVAKLGIGPGIFNINEPVLFGLPIVLNPIFLVPFIIAPLAAVLVAFLATSAGLVAPVVLSVPWVTPPILNAYMATGFDWRAIIVTIINLVITIVIWTPFVIAANKMEEAEEEVFADDFQPAAQVEEAAPEVEEKTQEVAEEINSDDNQ